MVTIVDLPAIGWSETLFTVARPGYLERMEGRRTESVLSGTSWWRGRFTTTELSYAEMGQLEAFLDDVTIGGAVFRAVDATRPRPIAHESRPAAPLSGVRAGGGAFDGTATIDARTSSSLTVSGLPAGFQLLAGDYVEVRKSASLVSLHRIRADAQANGSGEVSLSIRMPLDTGVFTLPLTANFEEPACLMQANPESFSPSKVLTSRQASFSAEEVFFS